MAAGLLFLIGCDFRTKPTTRAWVEDVLLDDASTIEVKRSASFIETNSLGGDAYNAVETDATIGFTGALETLPQWREPLMALLLYRDATTAEWVIVATTTSCDTWLDRGEPEPMYWEFRLRDREWVETPLSASSIGRPGNLLHRYQRKLPTNHITVSDRSRLQPASQLDEMYRVVVAEARGGCLHSSSYRRSEQGRRWLPKSKFVRERQIEEVAHDTPVGFVSAELE
ncbi:MAG TPA: hypothetical protein VE907_18465 [Gammaproteobacteria bacterium]|nr:hypothetical protein [Gammaproteobacteria bacterium]